MIPLWVYLILLGLAYLWAGPWGVVALVILLLLSTAALS